MTLSPLRGLLRRAFDRFGLALTLACVVLLTVASLMPKNSVGDPGPGADRTAHVLSYLLAMFPGAVARGPVLLIAAGVLAWSGIVELLQPLVGRAAGLMDFAANGFGVLAGLALGLLFRALLGGPDRT